MRGNQIYGRQNKSNRRGTLGTKITIEIGVGHMRDKIEAEEMIEVLVRVDQHQVQEQLQIGIGLDVSSMGSITISQEPVQQHRQTER